MIRTLLFVIFLCVVPKTAKTQEIEQFQVFAGRYDYLAFGNTMNIQENGPDAPCEINQSSTANFSLEPDQSIIAAYLYWAGSGTGDFDVFLNELSISAERTFLNQIDDSRVFFAAFSDVTEILQSVGNGDYTVSELDLTDIIGSYCSSGTNFAGWAITVIYEDEDLPLNVVNVFDGLESVSEFNNELSIQLENLNVLDNQNAKIGFVAWEGDAGLAVDETLSINGNILSNPPLNPANNQFNSTNSFTGASDLYNMDIDVYGIENTIEVGDTSATVTLTSGQDFVMINSIISVLNSQLPDAIITVNTTSSECDSRELSIEYTVSNVGTELLELNIPISFYINDLLFETIQTTSIIQAGESINGLALFEIPESYGDDFTLLAVVDDDGFGNGIVNEINEENNESSSVNVSLSNLVLHLPLVELSACDQNLNGVEIFDLTLIGEQAINGNSLITVSYHLSVIEAQEGINAILNPVVFESTVSSQEIYLRFSSLEDVNCLQVEDTVLTIIQPPILSAIEGLVQCDDSSNDGLGFFDFNPIRMAILNEQEAVLVTFHESESEALLDENPIQEIGDYQNFLGQEFIYVRVTKEGVLDCFEISFFPISVVAQEDTVTLLDLTSCNEGFETSTFDLTEVEDSLLLEEGSMITGYFLSHESAFEGIDPIQDVFYFQNTTNPQTIFVRTEENDNAAACPEFASFNVFVENCPPFVPDGFSPNNDGINDVFEISGLKGIFLEHRVQIYSRLGNLVYEGTNETAFWDGTPNRGILGSEVPVGVYFWVLHLNDPEFSNQSGWLYLNR